MNEINKRQDDEPQLKFIRARQQAYARAKLAMHGQLVLAFGLPLTGAAVATYWPEWKAYVAFASLLAVVIDAFYLDRRLRNSIKLGAKLGEEFDCRVLELPWDNFNVGDRADAEEVYSLSKSRGSSRDEAIRGWYPDVAHVPINLARIICQRSNVRYDSSLRRSYGSAIKFLVAIVLVALTISGLVQNLAMKDWVVTWALAVPFLTWAGKEYYRQVDAALTLDGLIKQIRALWDTMLSESLGQRKHEERSRAFQTALYRYRANSPLVLPILYRLRRRSLEEEMDTAASTLIAEYEQCPASGPVLRI